MKSGNNKTIKPQPSRMIDLVQKKDEMLSGEQQDLLFHLSVPSA